MIKPLHPVFAPLYALRILVINHLCMTDLANQNAKIEVHELVDFEGSVGLFALGTNVAFVIKFLQ